MISTTRAIVTCTAVLAVTLLVAACQTTPEIVFTEPEVTTARLGSTDRVHQCGSVMLASQPAEADIAAIEAQGYRSVLNLRTQGEMDQLDFDEREMLTSQGIGYHQIGIGGAEGLTDAVFDEVRAILSDADNHPLLVHCASANRVGAVWLAHRVLDAGLDYENALAEAKVVGLRSPALEQAARDYIYRQRGQGERVTH
ncbi:MAG: sulfur transferase domain-containing protein [Phycisphaeraceae bacterium]